MCSIYRNTTEMVTKRSVDNSCVSLLILWYFLKTVVQLFVMHSYYSPEEVMSFIIYPQRAVVLRTVCSFCRLLHTCLSK